MERVDLAGDGSCETAGQDGQPLGGLPVPPNQGRFSTVSELATLLARAYVRLLAARAEEDAVSYPENDGVSVAKPLDSRAETRPPCVGGGRRVEAR